VEESEITETESKFFFYRDQNRNSVILQGPKGILTLISYNSKQVLVIPLSGVDYTYQMRHNFYHISCIYPNH